MEVVHGTAALERPLVRPVLTIGNFDGLHIGHRAIMQTVSERARTLEGQAVVYTFEPHPRKVLTPGSGPSLLTTLEQKLELLEAYGIDCVILDSLSGENHTHCHADCGSHCNSPCPRRAAYESVFGILCAAADGNRSTYHE